MKSLLDPLLHINFQRAESLFMPLNGRLQGKQHPLCGEKIGNDSVCYFDGGCGKPYRLRIESEINDQFFGRPGNAAKVCIRGAHVGVVKFDGGRCSISGVGFRHGQ